MTSAKLPGIVPDAEDFVVQDPTPITDLGGMFKAMQDTKSVVQLLMNAKIPAIAKDAKMACEAAKEASQEVVIVRTRQEDFSSRLERMEKNGHPCIQTDKITRLQEQSIEWRQDKEEGIKTREMVRSAQEKIDNAADEIGKTNVRLEKAQKRPGRILAAVVGIGLSLVVAVFSGGWYLSGALTTVQSSIVTEAKVREAQLTGIKEHISQLPTKADAPTKAQVAKITKVVVENGHSFTARCSKLTTTQKNYLRRQVERGMLPPELQCP